MATFYAMSKMGVCTEWVDGRAPALLHEYENIPISNEIFSAEKCLFECFPMVPTRTFIIKYSNFKPNIFGWKVSFHMFSYGSNQDFYNYNSGFRIQNFQFQTEYFRLKSVFHIISYGFNQDFYNLKYSNFKRNIFGWKVSEHGPSVLPTMDFWDLTDL
jgi:hypothetical protein